MTNTLSRTQAKKWTLGAQSASVVFVLGAVALGVIGLPEPTAQVSLNTANTAGNPLTPTPAPTNNQNATAKSAAIVDTFGLAQRFALLDNAPDVPNNTPIIETPIDQDPGSEVTNPGEIAKRVRYIGFINEPDNRHAFIRIDGKQRIVSLGEIARAGEDGLSDLTVERITPNHIVLSDSDSRAKIDLANRSGQSITMIGGGNVDVTPAAENGSMLTTEDEARILAMPARQQPLARRRLERERRGLSPDKKNRRPTPEPLKTFKTSFNKKKPVEENN